MTPPKPFGSIAVRSNGIWRWTYLVGGVLHSAAIKIVMIAGGDHTITYISPPYERRSKTNTAGQIVPQRMRDRWREPPSLPYRCGRPYGWVMIGLTETVSKS